MSQFDRLTAVTDAMYLRAQQSLRATLVKEADLRRELDKLKTHVANARLDQAETLDQMQAIGADILWEGWVSKTRAHLNLELAKVLAQKEMHISKVRKAFGKKTVSGKLAHHDAAQVAKRAQQTKLATAIESAMWRKDQ